MAAVARPSTSPRLTRDEKKALTRARLLEAAAVVFARKGIAGASLEDVAQEAGLTKGAVYSNFESKEDLIAALLDVRLDEPLIEIADLVPHELTQEEQSRRAEALMSDIYDRERDAFLLGLEFNVYLARHPELAERYRGRYMQRRQAMTAEIVERAAEQGATLPVPADELAAGLFALAMGISLERLVNPANVPEGLFAKMLSLIMRSQ